MLHFTIIIRLLAMVFMVAACMPTKSINQAALKVENEWKNENDQILENEGRRTFSATKKQGFQAAQLAASRLGMVVEKQTYETGFIFMTAPAPVPLTMLEWAKVQEEETGELRRIIDEDLGLYKWWVELDPSGKDVLGNVFVTETPKGVDVSIGLRLRVKDSSTDELKRVQPPPTAVRIGLAKFWAAYEMELKPLTRVNTDETMQSRKEIDEQHQAKGQETKKEKAPALKPSPPAPPAANPDAVAVIIGNRNYRGNIPAVEFAHRDADAWKSFARSVLGVSERNIIDLRDATMKDMEAVLGNARTHQGTMWRWVRPGDSDLYVFYSGHGVPGLKDKRAYILPVDGNPDMAEIQGYPLDLLYRNLGKMDARSVTVFIDACFSGQSPGGTLVQNASGIRVVPIDLPPQNLTIFSAAQADQVASWDRDAQYGLFTRYLLSGLNGDADRNRYGQKDHQVTVGEIEAYLNREMSYAARRQYGRTQEAMVFGNPERVIVELNAK
jgi:hypothetical protein